MKSITILGNRITIPVETYKRIQKIARIEKITLSEAVFLCLKKVI